MPAQSLILDMTNVKEGGPTFNKRRVPEGDYLARVTKVEDSPVKNGDNKGAPQWLFTITLTEKSGAVYPYYCQTQAENQLWKIRNLLVAAGITVPRKRIKLNPERLVGKTIAVTLQDAEYEGKEQSEIAAIFPPSEMNGGSDNVEEDDDEEDEEEEETPAPKAKRRAAPEPEPEEDEDEEEEYEEPEPAPVARKKRKVAPPVEEDEDDEEEEDEEEEPPAPRKRAAKKAAPARSARRQVTDEELEELDIDDI